MSEPLHFVHQSHGVKLNLMRFPISKPQCGSAPPTRCPVRVRCFRYRGWRCSAADGWSSAWPAHLPWALAVGFEGPMDHGHRRWHARNLFAMVISAAGGRAIVDSWCPVPADSDNAGKAFAVWSDDQFCCRCLSKQKQKKIAAGEAF